MGRRDRVNSVKNAQTCPNNPQSPMSYPYSLETMVAYSSFLALIPFFNLRSFPLAKLSFPTIHLEFQEQGLRSRPDTEEILIF